MPEVLLGERRSGRPTAEPDSLARLAARFLGVAATIVVVGVGVDLFTLWVCSGRHSRMELVALGATTSRIPYCSKAPAIFYVAGAGTSLVDPGPTAAPQPACSD
jgi:hypothetical protein